MCICLLIYSTLILVLQNQTRTQIDRTKPAMSTQAHYMDSNFDVRSHYSDSAAVVATLYSLTATGGGIGGAGTNTAGAPSRPAAATAALHRSSSVTAAGGGSVEATINTIRQPATTSSSQSSSHPFHTNSLHRKPTDKLSIKSTVPSAYVTLQRPNGYFRSNQSLCSCNADSEVNAYAMDYV